MAISIYMEIESKNDGAVQGGCDIRGREGWMECLEMSHHVHIPSDRTTGSLRGNRIHDPYRIVKMTDKATPVLYKHLCNGGELTKVTLHFYTINAQGRETEYFRVLLENARIVSMQPVMYNTRKPESAVMPHIDEIQFVYEQITWTETEDNVEHVDNYRSERS